MSGVESLAPFGDVPEGTTALIGALTATGVSEPSDKYRTADGEIRLVWIPARDRIVSLDVSPDGTVGVVATRFGIGPSDILNYPTIASARDAAETIRQAVI